MTPFKWEGMLPKAVHPLTPPPHRLTETPASGLVGRDNLPLSSHGDLLQHPAPSLPQDALLPFGEWHCSHPKAQQQHYGVYNNDSKSDAGPRPLHQDPCGGWPGDRMRAPLQLSWLLGIKGCRHECSAVMSSPRREKLPLPGGSAMGLPSSPSPKPKRALNPVVSSTRLSAGFSGH